MDPFNDADVWARLRANWHPSSSERVALDTITRQTQDQILRSIEEGSQLQSQFWNLAFKRVQLETYQGRCQSLCSPIRRLPWEILSTIFALCSSWNQITDSQLDIYVAGVDISLVCRHRQRVAKSTMALWTNINVELDLCASDMHPLEDVTRIQRVERAVRSLLTRSGSAPLDIALTLDHNRVLHNPVIPVLISQSERYRRFTLDIYGSGFRDKFLDGVEDKLPILEHAAISSLYHVKGNDFSVFETASSLKSWTVDCFQLNDHTQPIIPSWNLTHVSLESLPSSFLNIVYMFKHLQSLRLRFMTNDDPSELDDDIPMRSLRDLDVTVLGTARSVLSTWEDIFRPLTAPALQSITLRGSVDMTSSWSVPSFQSFLQRSGCQLTSIVFDRLPIDTDGLIDTLKLLPCLTRFTYTWPWQENKTFPSSTKILTSLLDPPVDFLPHIEHIELKIRCLEVKDEDIARLVLESRSPMKTFRLRMIDRGFIPGAYDSWKDNHSGGFHAEVLSNDRQQLLFDEERALLQPQLDSLSRRREQLQAQLHRSKSLISPIRKLPNEILSEIFCFCGAANTLSDDTAADVPGLNLERVCYHWHAVAADTSGLWTTIDVYVRIPNIGSRVSHWVQNALDNLLRRSRSAPLDVTTIIGRYETLKGEDSVLFPLLQASDRWRSFSLTIRKGRFDGTILECIAGKIHRLETAFVYAGASCTVYGKDLSVFRSAPKLASWDISSGDDDVPFIPSANIAHVGLQFAPLTVLKTFPVLKRLRTIRMHLVADDGGPSVITDHISIPTLEDLTLIFDEFEYKDLEGYFQAVFDHLHTPKLNTLCLVDGPDYLWSQVGLENFLLRTNCTLTTLELIYMCVDNLHIDATLKLLPSLTTLVFIETSSTSSSTLSFSPTSFLETLLGASTQILPCLEHLDLTLYCQMVSDEYIARLLSLPSKRMLKTFRLKISDRDLDPKAYSCWRTTLLGSRLHAEVTTEKGQQLCTCQGAHHSMDPSASLIVGS